MRDALLKDYEISGQFENFDLYHLDSGHIGFSTNVKIHFLFNKKQECEESN